MAVLAIIHSLEISAGIVDRVGPGVPNPVSALEVGGAGGDEGEYEEMRRAGCLGEGTAPLYRILDAVPGRRGRITRPGM